MELHKSVKRLKTQRTDDEMSAFLKLCLKISKASKLEVQLKVWIAIRGPRHPKAKPRLGDTNKARSELYKERSLCYEFQYISNMFKLCQYHLT